MDGRTLRGLLSVSGDVSDERRRSNDIEGSNTEELLLVVSSGSLKDLGKDGDGRVDRAASGARGGRPIIKVEFVMSTVESISKRGSSNALGDDEHKGLGAVGSDTLGKVPAD